MPPLCASRILSLPVHVDGILVGHVVDLILDARLDRALGLEVRCGDGEHRFLPLAVARIDAEKVAAPSGLALLDSAELDFYARRGARFRDVRATRVPALDGPLADVELAERGAVSRLVAAGKGTPR